MKKEVKFGKTAKIQFYGYILERLGKDTVTTSDMYRFVNDAKLELGITKDDRKFCPSSVREFVSAIGNENIEVVIDDTAKRGRGRGVPEIYSLKLKKGNEDKDLERLRNRIRSYFLEGETKVGKEVKKETPKKARKMSDLPRKPKINFLDRVVKVLTKASKDKDSFVSYQDIEKLTGIKTFTSVSLNSWRDSLERIDLVIDVMPITRDKKRGVHFGNPRGDLFSVAEVMRRLYSVDIKPNKLLGIGESVKSSTPVVTTEGSKVPSHVDLTPKNWRIDNIMFSTAGILFYKGMTVDTDVICKNLNEQFGILITRTELLGLIKDEPEMVSLAYGSRISLKDEKSWEVLREKYNPKRYKLECIARIGIGIRAIKEFIPEVELLSKITEDDGVYRLVYNRSYRSMLAMQRLFRTFRGTDMIFDKTLEEELKQQIEMTDGRANKDYIPYALEKDI